MINPYGIMYLRPGNLWKKFTVKRLKTSMVNGYAVDGYVDTDICVTGVLAEATSHQSDMMRHRWDQDQHSLTHTLVVVGRPGLKKGDILELDERKFIVLIGDDIASIGVSNIFYLEERNDLNDAGRSCKRTGKGSEIL